MKVLDWLNALLLRLFGRADNVRRVAPPPVPPPPIAPPPPRPNRALRRRLERARRRRDKLVTPQGPQPIKQQRPSTPRPQQPVPQSDVAEDTSTIIAGELIEGDGQGDVLFEQSEFLGAFNFRDSILEQLDRYWVYLERMRKHDPDAYGFYKQVGATLVPYSATASNLIHKDPLHRLTAEEVATYCKEIVLPESFKKHRPTFGCIAVGANPLDERHEMEHSPKGYRLWCPKFMYFHKYSNPPPELQPMSGGDIYKLTVWWDRPQDSKHANKWGTPTDIGIFVSRDGQTIHALRHLKTEFMRVGKRGNNRVFAMIPQHAWHFPKQYAEWARSYGLHPETHMTHMFAELAKRFELAHRATARVSVSKGDLTAVFGIEPERLAYFFQDRDYQLTEAGNRRRIFHYVEPYTKANGTFVQGFYRGDREFDWAGYHVLITVPGLHHFKLDELDVGVIDSYWKEQYKKQKLLGEPQLGTILADQVHGRQSNLLSEAGKS